MTFCDQIPLEQESPDQDNMYINDRRNGSFLNSPLSALVPAMIPSFHSNCKLEETERDGTITDSHGLMEAPKDSQ